MVAFLASLAVTFACAAVIVFVGVRRKPGTPLTWGEAMIAAVFAFFVIFWIYGVVPHQFLTWADSELGWRPDRLLLGPGEIFDKLPFTLTWRVVRDIVVSGIYGVFLVAHGAAWVLWQKRGQSKPKQELSAFGRPILKKA